jgi:hypothetical protein
LLHTQLLKLPTTDFNPYFQPILADHVAHLGYINKLVGTMAAEGRRASMADSPQEEASQSSSDGPTPQERIRASCLRILHQLVTSTACAEAMAAPNAGAPQVSPKAVGLFCLFFWFLVLWMMRLWQLSASCFAPAGDELDLRRAVVTPMLGRFW